MNYPIKPPRPTPEQQIADLKGVCALAAARSEVAANRAEIACRFAERAETASFQTKDAVEKLAQKIDLRRATIARLYVMCAFLAALVSGLVTCYVK